MKPLFAEDFQEIVRLVCPHCRTGHEATQRDDTKEWVHTITAPRGNANVITHGICWANGLRNSAYAPKMETQTA